MIILTRTDLEQNMDRIYIVAIQPTLLHEHAVTCSWGRRGTPQQQQKIIPAESAEAAHELAQKIVSQKIKRGYVPYGSQSK